MDRALASEAEDLGSNPSESAIIIFEKKYTMNVKRTFVSVSVWMMVFCLVDQWVKYLIVSRFQPHEFYEVIPNFFSICYVVNTGASWGILKNTSSFLAVLGIITIFIVYVCLPKLNLTGLGMRIILACALGGILGNTIDRLCRGVVVDFLDFYIAHWHWPCFNLADIFICLSCIVFFIKYK